MAIKEVKKVRGDINARLLIDTDEQGGRSRFSQHKGRLDKGRLIPPKRAAHRIWVFGRPNRDGLRVILDNGQMEGKGVLLGSVKVGGQLRIKFSNRPESESIVTFPRIISIIAIE